MHKDGMNAGSSRGGCPGFPWLGLSAVVLAWWSLAAPAHAYTVEMTQREIEAMLADGFPIRQQTPFFTVTLSKPRVRIVETSNRLRLALAIAVAFPDRSTAEGRAEIEGEMDYDPDKGEFHLRQPSLVGLEFERLPPEYRDLVATIVGGVAEQRLPIIVLYRLDEKTFKQAMTRRMLRRITVKDGRVIAELEWK